MEPFVGMYYRTLANVEHCFRQIKDDAILSVLGIGLVALVTIIIALRAGRK